MAKLTLCMIVRDEEELLPACLESAKPAVDRMIVVDTGSTDGTRDVIRRFGAELVEFPWSDDFAAARNAGLERVHSGYVLVLDADERLTRRGARVLRAVARRAEIDLGMLPLHDATTRDAKPAQVLSGALRRGEPILLPRLLRHDAELRYEGMIHESVTSWARQPGRRIESLQAPIVHYGAADALREERGKGERNRSLLERRCAQEPEDPTPHAYLAAELRRAGQWKAAREAARVSWEAWKRCAERGEQHDPVLPASVLAHLAIRFGDYEEAEEVAGGALASEEHPNLHLLYGISLESRVLRRGAASDRLERAADHYRRCLALRPDTFASEVMDGASSWQAATRLGSVLLQLGDPVGAGDAFGRSLAWKSDQREAALGLAEATLDAGDVQGALARIEGLLAEPDPDAWLLAARAALRADAPTDARLFCERARDARERRAFVATHREAQLPDLEQKIATLPTASPAEARSEEPVCVFAWPNYGEPADLSALMNEYGELLADRPGFVLCLRHDAKLDLDLREVEKRLERSFADHLGADRDLRVMIVDQELDSDEAIAELARPTDIALELPSTADTRRRFLEHLGVRSVADGEALRAALGEARPAALGAAP